MHHSQNYFIFLVFGIAQSFTLAGDMHIINDTKNHQRILYKRTQTPPYLLHSDIISPYDILQTLLENKENIQSEMQNLLTNWNKYPESNNFQSPKQCLPPNMQQCQHTLSTFFNAWIFERNTSQPNNPTSRFLFLVNKFSPNIDTWQKNSSSSSTLPTYFPFWKRILKPLESEWKYSLITKSIPTTKFFSMPFNLKYQSKTFWFTIFGHAQQFINRKIFNYTVQSNKNNSLRNFRIFMKGHRIGSRVFMECKGSWNNAMNTSIHKMKISASFIFAHRTQNHLKGFVQYFMQKKNIDSMDNFFPGFSKFDSRSSNTILQLSFSSINRSNEMSHILFEHWHTLLNKMSQ